SSPAGVSCPGTCTGTFNYGAPVTLTQMAGTGSAFSSWSGACTGSGTCAVTITANSAVTATFNGLPFPINVTRAGNAASLGSVSSAPAGISCGATCSANFTYNTTVVLMATAPTG